MSKKFKDRLIWDKGTSKRYIETSFRISFVLNKPAFEFLIVILLLFFVRQVIALVET